MKPLQWLVSLIFIIQMYVAMAVIAVVFAPYALITRNGAFAACHAFCAWTIWSLRILCGLRTEVRGTPPTDEVVIAAKHQSFLDIIVIYHAIPRGKFIMKRELMWAPFLGLYAYRIGCVFVDRGKRGGAIAKMKDDVARGAADAGQLVIYPQGTRVAPGVKAPYRPGTALLYEQLGQPCVPVGTNVGVFWPKRGILRKRGVAVVEFLPPIMPGLPAGDMMKHLQTLVEASSDRLLAEAGFR